MMFQSATVLVCLFGAAVTLPLDGNGLNIADVKRATDFGSFDPNALYNQMSQQTQEFLSQNGVSSGSGITAEKSSSGSSSGASGSGTGGFDANALYQQQSQLLQQYISSHQTWSFSGESSSISSGSSSSISGSVQGSGSNSPGSGSSSASGSFDPNAMYQQQSQLNLQKLESTMHNVNAKFDANAVNKFQTSDGGSSGSNTNQFNAMNSNTKSQDGHSSGGQTDGQTSNGQQTDSQK